MKLTTEQNEYETSRPGEIHLHIRFRPASLVGILFVLLIHGLLLYFLVQIRAPEKQGKQEAAQSPLVLFVDKASALKMSKAERKKVAPKTTQAPTPPKPTTPAILSEEMTSLPPPPDKITPPELDMSTMLNAARERRRALAQENQEAQQGSRGMSPQEVAEANVRRSMDQASGKQGTGGMFDIPIKGVRTATLTFKGWPTKGRSRLDQSFEIDAGLDGNIDLAIIKHVITLLRTKYKDDFPWISRNGRAIIKSIRPEDNTELERFLMKEFFDTNI